METPNPGQLFISKTNTLCEMLDGMQYMDCTFKLQLPLEYIKGSERFCAKRLATQLERIEQRYIPSEVQLQYENKSTAFSADLPENHDTTTGLAQLEASYIEHILLLHRGNQTKAANALGISRNTIREKLKRYFDGIYIEKTTKRRDELCKR